MAKTAQAGSAAAVSAGDFIKPTRTAIGSSLKRFVNKLLEEEKSVVARDAEGKAAVALLQWLWHRSRATCCSCRRSCRSCRGAGEAAPLKLAELATMKEELKSLKDEVAQMAVVDDAKKSSSATWKRNQPAPTGLRQSLLPRARSSRLSAEQAKAEAEAYKDNSARLGELRDAYERTRAVGGSGVQPGRQERQRPRM